MSETRRAFFAKLVGAIAAVTGSSVLAARVPQGLHGGIGEPPASTDDLPAAAPPIGGRWSQAPGPAIAPTPPATRCATCGEVLVWGETIGGERRGRVHANGAQHHGDCFARSLQAQWDEAGLDYERSRPRVLPNQDQIGRSGRAVSWSAPIDVPPELRSIVAMRDQCNREIADWYNVQTPRPVIVCSCPDPMNCEHPYPQILSPTLARSMTEYLSLMQPYYTKDRA